MKFFGKTPLQQQMQQTQARVQAQQQRNLQGGWWLRQQRLKAQSQWQSHLPVNRQPIANCPRYIKTPRSVCIMCRGKGWIPGALARTSPNYYLKKICPLCRRRS